MNELPETTRRPAADPGDRSRALQRFFREAAKAPRTYADRAAAAPGGRRRRRRPSVPALSFLLAVALPAAAVGLYYGLVASDQYVATAQFTVKRTDSAGGFDGLGSSLGLSTESGLDTRGIIAFIESKHIVTNIEQDPAAPIPLRRLFADPATDRLSRFRTDGSLESFMGYWNGQVAASVTDGMATVEVRAFTPQDAKAILDRILAEAEDHANEWSAAQHARRILEAEGRVAEAKVARDAADAAIIAFQARHAMLDPRQEARNVEAALSTASQDLAAQSLIRDGLVAQGVSAAAPQMQQALLAIGQLQAVIADLRADLTGPDALNVRIVEYDRLLEDRQLALETQRAAETQLATAQADAAAQRVFVQRFVDPTLPETAEYPRRLWATIQIAVVLLGLWGIGLLIYYAVRDHRS